MFEKKKQSAVIHKNNISTVDTEQYYQPIDDERIDHSLNHQQIDIPFHFRHTCWFCSEPAAQDLYFPKTKKAAEYCTHRAISLPICRECKVISNGIRGDNIWQYREALKKSLAKKYQKHLAIGKNWTKEELENAGFEGGNFEGFAKSGWFMFEVARDRVNFAGWPLWCHGEQIEDITAGKQFVFDGVTYSDVNQAVDFYVKSFALKRTFLLELLDILGIDRFSDAIRYARIHVAASVREQRQVIADLSQR